jgi:hypothetical protein
MTDRESDIYATGYWNGIAYKNQQKTKPLTDEEIYEIWNTLPYDEQSPFDGRATYRFARAIEERHGIK